MMAHVSKGNPLLIAEQKKEAFIYLNYIAVWSRLKVWRHPKARLIASSYCHFLFKMEESSGCAYIFILICDCVQCRLPQPKENRRGYSYASLSRAAMLASTINQNRTKPQRPPFLPLLSHFPLPLPNQCNDTLFNDLDRRQRQDIVLLRAFGVVGVGARGRQGHFHIHLTECCLSPFCTAAL